MRLIKFRGRDINTGKYVYGDYCKGTRKTPPSIHEWQRGRFVDVEPESIAQLIGYDKNGAEVYEGDMLVDVDGWNNEYRAQLIGKAFSTWGCDDITEYISECVLKKPEAAT